MSKLTDDDEPSTSYSVRQRTQPNPEHSNDEYEEEQDDIDKLIVITKDGTEDDKSEGGWGWVVVFAAFIVYAIVFGTMRCQSVIFVPIVNEFRTSYSVASLVAALSTAGLSVAGLLSVPLMNKYGHRLTVMVGGLTAFVFCAVSAFVPSIYILHLTAGLLTGIGLGIAFVASPVIIGHYFSRKRAFATNVASMGASVGTFAICPLNAYLVDNYTIRGYFPVFAGICLQICVAGALMRPAWSSIRRKDVVDAVDNQKNGGESEGDNKKVLLQQLIASRVFIIYCVSQVVFLAGFIVNQLYIIAYAQVEVGISPLQAPLIMSIASGTEMFSRIGFGVLGDMKCINRILMFTASLYSMAVCALVFPFLTSFTSLAMMAALAGLCQGGFSGISVVILADIVGLEKYGMALGISTFMNGIGTLLTPPLVGIAVDRSGNPSTALFISAGILFVGATLTFMIQVVISREKQNNPGMVDEPRSTLDRSTPRLDGREENSQDEEAFDFRSSQPSLQQNSSM